MTRIKQDLPPIVELNDTSNIDILCIVNRRTRARPYAHNDITTFAETITIIQIGIEDCRQHADALHKFHQCEPHNAILTKSEVIRKSPCYQGHYGIQADTCHAR